MSPRRHRAGRARVVRAVIALAAVSASLGAVAFAATRPERGDLGLSGSKPVPVAPNQGVDTHGTGTQGVGVAKGEEALPSARFLETPESNSTASEPQFRFHVMPRSQAIGPAPSTPAAPATPTRRFQCRLDGADWNACNSPYRLIGLALGAHSLALRALSRSGRPGPAVNYSWQQVERQGAPAPERVEAAEQADPMPFSIESEDAAVDDLYPGYPAEELPVSISNPNGVSIEVTSVTAAIASDPLNCPAENFALTPSSASVAAPLIVPANGSVALPSATSSAPAIAMLNLPVNQDSCRGAEVQLVFSGEAHG